MRHSIDDTLRAGMARDQADQGSTPNHCPKCERELREGTRFCPYDGTRVGSLPPADPLLGSLIGDRYRVGRQLGAGGMAKVYLAHQVRMDMEVAFKVLRPDLSTQAPFVGRFAREAHAIARLDHPNVVSVYDFGQGSLPGHENFYYIVMEYVPGRVLDEELRRVGAMPPERVAHILSQIATGVASAHLAGIVHRDLKPSNIILRQLGSDEDFVMILDFGLSRSTTPDPKMPKLTAAREIVGTPHYMAPERFKGGDLDHRSDIYALGVIGYELLTGELPFDGPPAALVFKHVSEEPEPPSARVAGGVHGPLEALVLRCMEKDPAERYQSAEELLVDLGGAWRTLPRRSSRKTTYAATSAAPPRPSTGDLPDPTVWQSKQMDALTDGPGVIGEIARLVNLRRRHLAELAEAIWVSAPPPERVGTLRGEIDLLEDRMGHHSEEVALIESQLDEFERLIRGQEAELRGQILRANVELTCKGVFSGEEEDDDTYRMNRKELDSLASTISNGRPALTERPTPLEQPKVRLRRAEQSLASLHRKQLQEQLRLRDRLEEHVAEIRRFEAQLEVLYEELAKHLDGAVPRGSHLQPRLVGFQKLDGAITAYKGLLASLDVPR